MSNNDGYLCPYCGESTTFVTSTASLDGCIIRVRTCRFCGVRHETVETPVDIAGLVREARANTQTHASE